MKKTKEIIGLPIISISDGVEAGKVKDAIINADKGSIDYIVVDSGVQLSTKVIPIDLVLGIGEYALTIEHVGAINDINKIPAAVDLLQKNIQVKGTKVLTKKGHLIGEIGDVIVDEDTNCSIIGLEYIEDITQKIIRIIPRKSIITFGKNLLVVKDDVKAFLIDDTTQLTNTTENIEYQQKSPEINVVETVNEESHVQPDVVSDMMEMKHREYLNGKMSTKAIYDSLGNLLIEENTLINDAIFEIAKNNGKVIDLVMNNK